MAHMDPLPDEEALANSTALQNEAGRLEAQFGFIPNSIRTMARRPALLEGFLALQRGVMAKDGSVPFELKKLVSHIASKASGCLYCQAHTTFTGDRGGIEEERLANLWEYQTSKLYTDAEKAALDFALAGATVPNGVTETHFENLRKYWDDNQIVEILGVICFFGYLNRWNDSMATTLEDPAKHFAEGLFGEKGWQVGKHA